MTFFGQKFTWIHFVYLAWVASIAGFLGSLIYSNVLLVPICNLCWYQRIVMYPLVIIYLVGILFKDKNCVNYALPLSLIGLFIAIYQVLLQAGIVPNILFGCQVGVSCAEITFRLFGLFTIPQQAIAGFGSIVLLNVLALRAGSSNK